MRTQHKSLSRNDILESARVPVTANDYARMSMENARVTGEAVGSWNFYAKPVPADMVAEGWLVWLMPEVNDEGEGITDEVQPVWLTEGEVAWRLAEAIRADEALTWSAKAVLA